MMRSIIALILISFASCQSHRSLSSDRYLPSYLQSFSLGMSQKTCLQKRPSMIKVHSFQETPRHIFSEEAPDKSINTAYYFFEKEGAQNLVEMHFLYNNKETAVQLLEQLFGPQKDKQNKWHKTLSDGTKIHATLRKNKLFIYQSTVAKSF